MGKRKVAVEVVSFCLGDIHPAKYNPRGIGVEAYAALARLIEKFGCVEPIIVNVRGGKNTIVGGHQRYEILCDAGVKECLCVTVDLSDKDEKLLNLTLNNPAAQGEFIEELDKYTTWLLKMKVEHDKNKLTVWGWDTAVRERTRWLGTGGDGLVFTKTGIIEIYLFDKRKKGFFGCRIALVKEGQEYVFLRAGKITKLGAGRIAKRFARDVAAGKVK